MKDELFSVAGKVVVVTGGSRGIGAMIAQGFVERGARTYLVSREEASCRRTAGELSAYGHCVPVPGDVSTLEGIIEFVQAFSGKEDALDVLINNAGISCHAPFDAYPESGWDQVMQLNLKSPFFLTQRLLPYLKRSAKQNDPARVINIASMAGTKAFPSDNFAYSVSKAGLIHLTKCLAALLAPNQIAVNAISPSLFRSNMTENLLDQYEAEFAQGHLLGRIGSPEDIVGASIYLASRAGAWLTGANIPVDGGVVATWNAPLAMPNQQ